MNDFILSAFADEYADSFEEQLQAMKALDIRYIEIRHLDGKNISALSDKQVNEAKRMLDASGIKVSAIGSPLGKIRLDGDMGEHLEVARRIFEAANILGTPYIRIFSFYAPEGGSIADMRGKVLNIPHFVPSSVRPDGLPASPPRGSYGRSRASTLNSNLTFPGGRKTPPIR